MPLLVFIPEIRDGNALQGTGQKRPNGPEQCVYPDAPCHFPECWRREEAHVEEDNRCLDAEDRRSLKSLDDPDGLVRIRYEV